MAVYMYWFDTQKHHMSHIHVRYRGVEAVFDLAGRVLEGDLGARAERLITEWCLERSVELEAAWQCAAAGKELPLVLPLR